MSTSDHHILGGEIYFGKEVRTVSTLLGSCVAVVIWHPKLKYGGMCHIILPENRQMNCSNKYANCAIASLSRGVKKVHSRPKDYVTHVYGGGDMFMNSGVSKSVGHRNVEAVLKILKQHRFVINRDDVGGNRYQKIKLDLVTGMVDAVSVKVGTTYKKRMRV